MRAATFVAAIVVMVALVEFSSAFSPSALSCRFTSKAIQSTSVAPRNSQHLVKPCIIMIHFSALQAQVSEFEDGRGIRRC